LNNDFESMITPIETNTWRKALLPTDASIEQAIKCLDETSLQIVLIVSKEDILFGTLTDGDIRRALLKGLTLQCQVNEIVHRNPLVSPPEMGRDMVLQLMQANRVHQLPVVDTNRRVIGLHLWDEILAPTSRANQMVIMAGGRGTRLYPHTENCPKPMLEVGGKPMLEHIIQRAKADGFVNFTLAVHYLGKMIEDYFDDGHRWGVDIEYLREESPLGTAGALSLFTKHNELPIIVTNGDVLSDVHYDEVLEFHSRHQAAATMAVRQHEMYNPFGVVRTSGVEITGFEEKPVYRSHINAGIYVLNPDTLNLLEPQQHCDMPTLFTRIQDQKGRAIVYPMHELWLDVGRPEDLARANSNKETK
jgi:dTDP-glucose pyrophosphorylase